ncbi:hypothetical protein BC830DRAFT_1166764 [Chytriomyces sp. MP71]|nr:hypothetical protein BC830DRAFT_1166764 [Chytriomyces sp. MP71]
MVVPDNTRTFLIHGLVQSTIAATLNLIVVACNAFNLHKLTPSSFLIFWLCGCDSGLNILAVYIISYQFHADSLGLPASQCQALAFFITLFACSSIGLCTGLTFFRYLVVVRQWNLSPRFAPRYVLLVFILCSALVALPFILDSANVTYGLPASHCLCTVQWQDAHLKSKIMVWLCIGFLAVPLSSIGYAYAAIYREMRRSVKEMDSNGVGANSSGMLRDENVGTGRIQVNNGTVPRNKDALPPCARSKEREKMHALLIQSIAIVAVFVVGWGPYMANALYQAITQRILSPEVEYAAEAIVVLMHIVNPIAVMVFDIEMREQVICVLNTRKNQRSKI